MGRATTVEETASFEIRLVGAGGEPVDFWRTATSHGVASLPPMRLDEPARRFAVTLPAGLEPPRTLRVGQDRSGWATAVVAGSPPTPAEREALRRALVHILRLDEDLSPFYAMAAADPDLAWATAGAGRMIRGATVFEDVAKTICTTNCAWSATERMVGALVAHLGEEAPGGGRAFPTPAAMAAAPESFYRETVRAGYRGRYLKALAEAVEPGEIDLEALAEHGPDALPDEEVGRRLLALPGVGPYAAAHAMMMLGRYSRLILDSWTRPTYARLTGGPPVPDREIEARFARYGRYAGLAFWLLLTRDWVADE